MVLTGEEDDRILIYFIDQAVLLVDAPRPASTQIVFEGLGFADTAKGMTQDVGDESHYSQLDLPVELLLFNAFLERLLMKGDRSHRSSLVSTETRFLP